MSCNELSETLMS